jgi:cation:H+ antiporter
VLLLLLGLDGRISTLDGVLLFAGVVAYTVFAIWQSRRDQVAAGEPDAPAEEAPKGATGFLASIGLVVVGLGLLALGASWLVGGAVAIARLFGLSELIIGLTIIAVGTSLPEVAASIIAALRGQRDIAVGNVVGSNLFNILAILGLTSVIAPGGVAVPPAALTFDIPVMIAVALACLPIFFTGYTIARWEGWLFLGYYLAYTAFLLLDATGHDALPAFSTMLGLFVLPLTAVTLLVLVGRALRAQGHPWAPERTREPQVGD